MVRTLCDIFAMRGWDTTGVFSGGEAVQAVEEEVFDVVLMDILMPGMTGVEALRAIRASNPAVRVILMTAYTASELIDQATRDGAVRVLFKPVVIPELLEFLEATANPDHSVLIVDDDPDFLTTLSDSLRDSGHEILVAEDLDTALRLLEEAAAGIVVLDLRLNDLEPHDSILAIKEMHPSVVLILCSGYPNLLEETAKEVPADWVYARLPKPFAPDRLLELLDAV